MTLSEDVRRLSLVSPWVDDGSWGGDVRVCFACGERKPDHREGCRWLVLPKLVEVVDAADILTGVVRYYLENMDSSDARPDDLADALRAYEAALQGEVTA